MRDGMGLCPDEQARAVEEAGRARAQNAQVAFFSSNYIYKRMSWAAHARPYKTLHNAAAPACQPRVPGALVQGCEATWQGRRFSVHVTMRCPQVGSCWHSSAG